MMEMRTILVLMSTYNGERYLTEQLDSILGQENLSTVVLIRDDGSKDSTKDIIRHYMEKFPDRIKFEEGSNLGFAMSFTSLLQRAYNDFPDFSYYAFADQDDVWDFDKLYQATQLLGVASNDIPVSYCSNTTLVDAELNYLKQSWRKKDVCISKPRALVQSFATGCTMVFNRRAVELYVKYLPKEIRWHDFLMYQICVFLGQVIYDHHSHIKYRQHGNNQIGRPGFFQRMVVRTKGHYKEHVLEKQNKYFLEAYKTLLSAEDIELIGKVANYRRNFLSRFSLLFNPTIRYNTLEAEFFYRLKVLVGWL